LKFSLRAEIYEKMDLKVSPPAKMTGKHFSLVQPVYCHDTNVRTYSVFFHHLLKIKQFLRYPFDEKE